MRLRVCIDGCNNEQSTGFKSKPKPSKEVLIEIADIISYNYKAYYKTRPRGASYRRETAGLNTYRV